MKHLLLIGIILICVKCFFAQNNCSGTILFTEPNCAGDEVSATERELFRIINEYRAQNNLPPVALSEPLSLVANRHIIDLTVNVKSLTHGWSNCPYDINKRETWNCVFQSPQRLKTNFPGRGFENLYENMSGSVTPAGALEAWKKSPMHNNLILNLDVFKKLSFDAFGVAISGNYASIWFGSSGKKKVKLNKETKGLGVSFAKLVTGLTTALSIEKESSVVGDEKWVGKSADNSIKLEIYGQEKNINETSMSFSVKLDKQFQLTPEGRSALSQFLKNLAPDWTQRDKWFDEALPKIAKDPKSSQKINVGKKAFEVKLTDENFLTVLVKRHQKPVAKEL